MIVKQIIDEDFTNYKKPSMFIVFPNCTWKCGKEICQNQGIAEMPDVEIDTFKLVRRYLENPITNAIVCGGLEPFDSFEHLIEFVSELRKYTEDDVVIYTGYIEEEIKSNISMLSKYKNIIVKFGRYIPNQDKHYDKTLGVYFASDNQYGKVIS